MLYLGLAGIVCGGEHIDYVTQVKPLLRARCFACHGALKQEAGLRLDTAAAMFLGGDSGAAVIAGDEAASLLIERVSATAADQRMPPEFEGEQLSHEEIQLLRDWLAQGALAPEQETAEADPREHWAFQPIRRPEVPERQEFSWARNPIDAFIAEKHQLHGLTAQQPASRVILLRRLYLDLIGIPPSLEEIAAVQQASDEDWYPQTVERLLNDPRYGERWARHWMDIWRYSDWWGLGEQLRNSQPHIWHWRDWIIESLNDDLAYDEMLRLMLAADELYPEDQNKLRATGYLARNFFLFNRPQWMEETVEHVGKGFLGLTLNCAKCHDHKYDPVEQVDFYRMRAFFEPYYVRMDMLPGESDLGRDGLPRVFDSQLNTPTYRYIRGQETQPDKSIEISPGIPEFLAFDQLAIQPVTLPPAAWQPERQPWVFDNHLATATSKLESAQAALATAQQQLASTTEKQAAKMASDSAEQHTEVALPPATIVPAEATSESLVVPSQADLQIAQAGVQVAQAEVELALADQRRVVAVAAAMQAEWAVADNPDGQPSATLEEIAGAKTVAAIRSEREVAQAKAQLAVATAQQRLVAATDEKKSAAEKALTEARAALDKANEQTQAEIAATHHFTKLIGAQWTPTRFFNSGKDDPIIEFVQHSTGRRTALAAWITDQRNPLTARVAANHIWTRHMGQPLVATAFDFGRNGSSPTHPALLDWLASELIEHNWSMKHLHRLIVNSATYRLSSTEYDAAAANLQRDPDNRYWWRRPAIRLESQVVRDSILALSGNLDATIGGPPILPTEQAASTRRSLYFFHSNNDRNLFLTTFDEALVKDCYRREQSIVPQQALALTNSRLVLESAEHIAQRLSLRHPQEQDFIHSAFTLLLGFSPSAAELDAARLALVEWRKLPDADDTLARTNFIWALMNHNDFVTLR